MRRGDARRVLRSAAVSYVLMPADATGAMLEPGPLVWGCDGQVNLAAKEKASIQWQSGVASGEYAGRTTRRCGRKPGWVCESRGGSAESHCWDRRHLRGKRWCIRQKKCMRGVVTSRASKTRRQQAHRRNQGGSEWYFSMLSQVQVEKLK